jgi:hypothetical protein
MQNLGLRNNIFKKHLKKNMYNMNIMFHYKDINLKMKRAFKKKNNNKKDTKGSNRDLKEDRKLFYSDEKVLQQHLNDEFGIKVHKNTLRGLKSPNNNCIVDNNDFDKEIGCDKMVGNIEQNKLDYVLTKVNVHNLKIDPSLQHDKTKWKNSKHKSKKERNYDLFKNCEFYTFGHLKRRLKRLKVQKCKINFDGLTFSSSLWLVKK